MIIIVVPNNINETLPLIYRWEIMQEGHTSVYIGKAKGGSKRPRRQYKYNVNRLLSGKPYRNAKGAYRRIHTHLAQAVIEGQQIQLSFLCNIGPKEDINAVEQWWITYYKQRLPKAYCLNDTH